MGWPKASDNDVCQWRRFFDFGGENLHSVGWGNETKSKKNEQLEWRFKIIWRESEVVESILLLYSMGMNRRVCYYLIIQETFILPTEMEKRSLLRKSIYANTRNWWESGKFPLGDMTNQITDFKNKIKLCNKIL